MPTEVLTNADAKARGDAREFVAALVRGGVAGTDAKALAGMVGEMSVRGQFGATRMHRDQTTHRAERVVSFHDTPRGRYVYLVKPNNDGRSWSTVTPADNRRLAACVSELLSEV